MTATVKERCRTIGTFRHVSVTLMEMLAAWTPTTAEMEAKVVLGRHIWEFAQHADRLGKRTFELRQKEHYSLRPIDAYSKLLDAVAAEEDTQARLSGFYDGIVPGLIRRCRDYLERTDPILDAPSVAIVERNVHELERMCEDVSRLQQELKLARGAEAVASDERAIDAIVAPEVEHG